MGGRGQVAQQDRADGVVPGQLTAEVSTDIGALEPRISGTEKRVTKRDTPPAQDWPRKAGTTVYWLVGKLVGGEDRVQ